MVMLLSSAEQLHSSLWRAFLVNRRTMDKQLICGSDDGSGNLGQRGLRHLNRQTDRQTDKLRSSLLYRSVSRVNSNSFPAVTFGI